MPTSLPLSACCLLKSHHLPAVIPNEFWPFCTHDVDWERAVGLLVVVVIVQCWWWWTAGLYVLGITSALLEWTKTNTKHSPSNKDAFCLYPHELQPICFLHERSKISATFCFFSPRLYWSQHHCYPRRSGDAETEFLTSWWSVVGYWPQERRPEDGDSENA